MNPAEAAASIIVDEALRGGVTEIVVSPGQRSAPLAVAAAAAAADGACRLHVRIDERSAAFLALGLTRASGAPTMLIATSGTAVANWLPAVTEADASDVPLVLVTADRPPELLGVGANQAIAQADLYGARVRAAVSLEAPAWRDGVARYWRSTISQALNTATDAVAPGPVHVNVSLREPLLTGEPHGELDGLDADVQGLRGRPAGLPWTLDARLVSVASLAFDSLLEQLDYKPGPRNGVVVVGDVAAGEPYPSEATVLAEGLNWPLLCEPTGNAHDGGTVVAHGALLCDEPAFLRSHVPDVVVTVGRVGLSRPVNALIKAAGLHIAVDPRPAGSPLDPQRTADVVVSAVPAPAEICRAEDSWVADWLRADDAISDTVAAVLANEGLCAPTAARLLWQHAPGDGLVWVAASRAVRLLDSYAEIRNDPPWVMGNRGASGIDGVVSTVWGAALGHQRQPSPWDEAAAALSSSGAPAVGGPVVALIGDLAFLHDINGLVVPADEPRPDLTYVVLDNDGGGIFSGLEAGLPAYDAHFERVFGTPIGRDLTAYAAAAGVPTVRVRDVAALVTELDKATAGSGVRVVVADVGTRSEEQAIIQRLRDEVRARLRDG